MKDIKIEPKKDLVFDDKVSEQCKSCKRYGKKATCPPYIEKIDYYKNLLPTYEKGIIYYKRFDVKDKNKWVELGKKSRIEITNYLITKRNKLMKEKHYFVIAFGAGSCKICKECSFPCKHPDKSLIPMEGTGMNVIEMMKKKGIGIETPINNHFYRIGLILYD